jgi:hypothetical protein
MCCFSGPVNDVSATRIFARMVTAGRQVLAYEMRLATAAPVAMILAVPVPARSADDAVRFISLERYPELFADLHAVFHPVSGGMPGFFSDQDSLSLKVHEVGAFVASFVPSLADFARLDPQFRLPAGTLDRVPGYADWGFVVFQLAATTSPVRVHPMAFEFPTREPRRLFFPLVHVHDGVLHTEAHMDHALYAQGIDGSRTFITTDETLARYPLVKKAEGLIDGDAKLSWRELVGRQPNRDLWVELS